jgi:DICT domain-containing protein
MPAILAEVTCLSHPEEARLLATPQYRQDIAQALWQGIRAYAQALNRFPKISQESRYAESALEGWGRVTGKMRKSFQG